MSSLSKVMVTGASGFVGSHMVDQLLRAGYAVRGVCRSPKAEQLRKNCTDPNFEVVVVDDLVTGDFSEALRDVMGVIHVASPMTGAQDSLEVAISGTMNVIRQAYAAKVYKVTLISSVIATFTTIEEISDASRVITNKDWRKVAKEDTTPNMMNIYANSKTIAELAAWEFADAHPELDLSTLLPPFIYGPLAPAHVISAPSGLSTNYWLYQLVARQAASYPALVMPHAVDVRDVAKIAVRTLSSSSSSKHPTGEQRRRRLLLHGGSFTWTDVVSHLARARPELRSRLVDGGHPCVEQQGDAKSVARFDTTAAKELLGDESFICWQQMVEDAMDSILKKEATGEIKDVAIVSH